MAADPNVFQQFLQPVRSVASYGAELDQAEGNKLALAAQRFGMQSEQQKLADAAESRRALNAAYAASGGDRNKLVQLLSADPRTAAQGMAMEKSAVDIDKARAGTEKDRATAKKTDADARYQAADRHARELFSVSTIEDVARYVDDGIAAGVFPPQAREKAIAEAQQIGPQAWKAKALTAAVGVLDRFKEEAQNSRNAATVAATTRGQDLTAETSRRGQDIGASTAMRGQDITVRGQNLVDARARETTSAAMSKPFEVTGPNGDPILVQQDKQGNIKPVEGFAPKGGTAKPLPAGVLKQLTEARSNAATIDRLTTSFKPDYAGKGVLGFGADVQLDASGRVGADKDAVEWWKNYRKESELVERHALFGAALTPSEQASWRSADIGPGMDAKVVARNLATRAALSKKVFENTAQDLKDAGHSEKRITAIAGRDTAVPAAPSGKVVNFSDLK